MPAEEDMSKSSIILLTLLTVAFTSCTKRNSQITNQISLERQKEVVIYTYDSFISEWGPGSEIQRMFEEETDYQITWVNCGESVQVLTRAILEKNNTQADVLLGLDNNLSQKAVESNILLQYKPQNADEILQAGISTILSEDWYLTPYDYSHFAMIYDSLSTVPCPSSLEDLTNPVYKNKIILMDPRTSTPGLGFLAWTVAVYGEDVNDYWARLKPNILTMAPSWSTGYGLFKKNEAPLVISYTTSAASHIEYDNTDRYKTVIFEQGHTIQVEGVGILQNAPNVNGAKSFVDFLISEKAQEVIPLTQWMNPVNVNVKFPESYTKAAPIPQTTLTVDATVVQDAVEIIMQNLSKFN